MGSDWIMDPILQLVERSAGIIDPTLGSMDMSAGYITFMDNKLAIYSPLW